jgi:hypothetical protein
MSLGLWLHPANVADCGRAFLARVDRARNGHVRLAGDAAAIIEAGIDRTWNGRSFTASPGWFHTFWVRDMCFSSVALERLGGRHRRRLVASLARALAGWERHGSHITTTFHPGGYPADVYAYGVDSLPFFLAALRAVGADGDALVARHRAWLGVEVERFAALVVDPATGLQRSDRTFSAHRDTVTNRSNAYGNSMVALLSRTIASKPEWGLHDPLARHFPGGDFGRLLREHFWMPARGCFRDALGSDETTGEANVWPFWTGAVDCPVMLAVALATLSREGFCDPHPLRYTTRPTPTSEVWLVRHFLPDYQGSSVWTSIGAIYLALLRTVDPERAAVETARYSAWIERDGTYWEVLGADGGCWRGRGGLMLGEESMLWGAIFLDHLRSPAGPAARLA